MTIASPPVLAAECVTASAHTSLSGSRQVNDQPVCTGRSPAYWLAQQGANGWPSGYFMQTAGNGASGKVATLFGTVFGGSGGFTDQTFLQVLQAGHASYDRAGLAAHLVAAVLNAEAGYTPSIVLSVSKAQAIWQDYNSLGYFEPTAGVRWDSTKTIDWLKTTMPLAT